MEVEDYNMTAQWSFLLLVSGEEIFNTMMITKMGLDHSLWSNGQMYEIMCYITSP